MLSILIILILIIALQKVRGVSNRLNTENTKWGVEEIYGEDLLDQHDYARDGFKILESHEGDLYGSIESNKLYKTSGINSDRYLIHEFQEKDRIVSMESLANGNFLVCTSESRWLDKANGKIYLGKEDSPELKKVLDLAIGDAYHWNYAHDEDGYVFISEYGYKGEDNNARRIYRSKDFGESFELVYEPETEEGYHNHIIHIDKNDSEKIYQVIGDDNKRLLISEDRGDSWRSLDWGDYHPTSIIDMGDYLLMGLDGVPYSGIISFDKETEEISKSLKLNKPDGGSVYTMLETDGKIYAGFMSYADKDSWDGTIYTSEDGGESWEREFSFDKLDESAGLGIYKFIENNGEIYIDMHFPYMEEKSLKTYFGTVKLNI